MFSTLILPTLPYILHLVSVFAAVDQDLSDRIAKAIGHASVKPLRVAPASQAVRFQYNERPAN